MAMRGYQIADALKSKGFDVEVRLGPSRFALRNVKDSLIVCVKSCPRFTGWLTKKNNKIIYDALDYTPLRGIPKVASAIIAGTNYMKNIFEKVVGKNTLIKTIYHHCDPKLQPHVTDENSLKLVYNGAPESSAFLKGELPDLNILSFEKNDDWREKLRNYNAHFSGRLDPYKSVIKLANVASMKAIFLTGAEPGCIELLGKDYPYFLQDPTSLTKVMEDIENLKSSVGTSTWQSAKNRIQEVYPKLTIDATANAYQELFADLA